MDILEKCAYLQGLCEGLNFDKETKEGQVIGQIIELLDTLCQRLADISDDVEALDEIVDEIDHDLGDVESDLYNEEDDGDCECECGECHCGDENCACANGEECHCGHDCCPNREEDEEDDEDFIEAMCPHCAETICFNNEINPDTLVCPACGKPFKEE